MRKLLETINHFRNVEKHKINFQQSVAFIFSTVKKNTEKEIMDILSFTIPLKTTKYLRINITQKVKDNENFKILKKEIENDMGNKRNHMLMDWFS